MPAGFVVGPSTPALPVSASGTTAVAIVTSPVGAGVPLHHDCIMIHQSPSAGFSTQQDSNEVGVVDLHTSDSRLGVSPVPTHRSRSPTAADATSATRNLVSAGTSTTMTSLSAIVSYGSPGVESGPRSNVVWPDSTRAVVVVRSVISSAVRSGITCDPASRLVSTWTSSTGWPRDSSGSTCGQAPRVASTWTSSTRSPHVNATATGMVTVGTSVGSGVRVIHPNTVAPSVEGSTAALTSMSIASPGETVVCES